MRAHTGMLHDTDPESRVYVVCIEGKSFFIVLRLHVNKHTQAFFDWLLTSVELSYAGSLFGFGSCRLPF